MAFNMYTASVPVLVRYLKNTSNLLDKGAAFCAAKKIDPSVLLSYRLAPDMFPLSRQIQILSDAAKGAGARLAGVEVPSFPDTETTVDDLKARIAKTVSFLEGLKESQFSGAENRDISFKAGPNDIKFRGDDYLSSWVFPNFFFHVTAAYSIMRHMGVELGKRDYLGM
ncbi:MAG: DUF1993 family protein [Rhodospirillaceae bacterium]